MIILFVSCGAVLDIETHEWAEETPSIQYSYNDLNNPIGLLWYDEGLLVTDSEEGTISFLFDGESTQILDALPVPGELIQHDERIFFTTESSIEELFVDEEASDVMIDGLASPSSITWHDDTLYWLEEGVLYSWFNEERSTPCTELASPYHITVWNDALWVTTQDDKGLWSIEDDICTKIQTFEDIPHRMTVSNQNLWITTRSFRWPYGGWIVSFDGSQIEKITESPPEPEHIIGWNEQIIWSSKQSITSFEDSPYEMLAAQTTTGAFVLFENTLYWSDVHGGRIGMRNLSE